MRESLLWKWLQSMGCVEMCVIYDPPCYFKGCSHFHNSSSKRHTNNLMHLYCMRPGTQCWVVAVRSDGEATWVLLKCPFARSVHPLDSFSFFVCLLSWGLLRVLECCQMLLEAVICFEAHVCIYRILHMGQLPRLSSSMMMVWPTTMPSEGM